MVYLFIVGAWDCRWLGLAGARRKALTLFRPAVFSVLMELFFTPNDDLLPLAPINEFLLSNFCRCNRVEDRLKSKPNLHLFKVGFFERMDTGLSCLVIIARYYQLPIEAEQLRHEFIAPGAHFTEQELLLAAKAVSLKAKKLMLTSGNLDNAYLPAIAKRHDGRYFIIAKVAQAKPRTLPADKLNNDASANHVDRVLIHDPMEAAPQNVTIDELDKIWDGTLIATAKRGAFTGGLHKPFDISWFIPSLIKYRKIFGEIVLASFFLQIFALMTPLFFQVVMDKVLVHQGFTTLDVLAVGFFIVVVFEALMGGMRNYLLTHTTNRMDVELGSRLYQHLLRLPLSYFEARQVGQNVARVRELDTIRNFITGTALTLIIDLSFMFIFLGVMWYYSATLTWVVLATIPFYLMLSLYITPILRHRLDQKFRHGAANTAFLTESITGINTVKSLAVEPQMRRRLEEHLANYVHASFQTQNLSNIAGQIAGLINKMMILGIVWFGAHLVMSGKLTVGQLVAFNMLAGRVSGPILKLVQLWQDFQQAGISVARLGDILNAPVETSYNANRSRLPRLQGSIIFDQVYFRYTAGGALILKGVSLNIAAGQFIGIVGRSGSGKSTLSKLVQRLYSCESGRVLVDGVDLSVVDTTWLRQQIGVVLQENFLFNRSIRENIALADPSTPMAQVIAAAKIAGAHEFIVDLADGYDAIVGEQGSNLSGGQRQRLAIARALIGDPKILIFDEATSALDYESERIIQNNMAAICKNRTVISIAHRLSTVRQCDIIYVMDGGRILESGHHEALIQLNGYYATLYNYQNHSPILKSIGGEKGDDSGRYFGAAAVKDGV